MLRQRMSSVKDPAKRKAYQQQYLLKNRARFRESRREYLAQYRKLNIERLRAAQYAYRREYPDRVKAAARKHREAHPQTRMMKSVKKNAKLKNLECNLTLVDLPMPVRCPILGLDLDYSYGTKNGKIRPNSPSVDRVDPTKGYVKGNVQVISMRANTIKSNATAAELRKVADYMELFA